MPLRNGLTKAKSFSKRHSYNDKEKLVVQMRSSSMVSNIMARGRQHDRTASNTESEESTFFEQPDDEDDDKEEEDETDIKEEVVQEQEKKNIKDNANNNNHVFERHISQEYPHLCEPAKHAKIDHKCILLDVGGEKFVIRRGTLQAQPCTRLAKLARATSVYQILELCDEFVPGDPPEFFFDRNPQNFPAILDMFRTGVLHTSVAGCAMVLKADLEYWGVDEESMEACCALKYYPKIEICQSEKEGDIATKRKEMELAEEEDFGMSDLGQLRSFIWNTMEYPWTSTTAQIMAYFSLVMVLISTVTFILSTFDELQINEVGEFRYPMINTIIEAIDHIVITFFSIEYLVRFICSPRKLKFMMASMNLVDILAIMPFYISLLLEGLEDFEIIGKAGKIVRLVRIMRILRIYKLVRHFAGLQALFFTLQQAYKELGLLVFLVGVALLIFSSLVYFAEKDGEDVEGGLIQTWTFIESFWWGLMTLTTVGYELSPVTIFGKIIGGMCALSGIFILTLPIPIVVNSFASFYKNRLWRTEVAHKKRERTRQQAKEKKEMQKMMLFKTMAGPGFFFPTDFTQPPAQTNTAVEEQEKKELVVFNPVQHHTHK